MKARRLIDKEGRINPNASPQDLEIICTDPTYKRYLGQVPSHPSCWPELAEWVWRKQNEPSSAGAPPVLSDKEDRQSTKRTLGSHFSRIHFAALDIRLPWNRVLIVSAALILTAATFFSVSVHLIGSASADSNDGSAVSRSASIAQDVLDDANDTKSRAQRSPVYDQQLKSLSEQIDQAIASGDPKSMQAAAEQLDKARQQKTNVRTGEVSSSISSSIEQATQLRGIPDSESKRRMVKLSDKWAGRSVDETNLKEAEADAAALKASVADCRKAKTESDRRQAQRKREQKQQQQPEPQPAQSDTSPSVASPPMVQPVSPQQTVPKPAPTLQAPQRRAVPQVPQSNGTDGVTIG